MTTTSWRLRALAIVWLPCMLAACGVVPTHHYSLADTAPPSLAPASGAVAGGAAPVFIELAPVAVPERLARPQMVVRQKTQGDPRVEILEHHRWSSSFESELRDAVAGGVASRLGAIDASRSGRPGGQGGWRIALQLQQFDAVPGDRVDARVSWTLRSSGEGPGASCQLALTEPVGPGMDALAQGAQRVVGRVSDAIARSITGLQAGQAVPCAVG